ncbi:small serum protein 2-like isoform X2 [Ornithorhynchus anatinus]|nr:small serum protein 2-like isoform X2 [Ornithorhynchus anatinus]
MALRLTHEQCFMEKHELKIGTDGEFSGWVECRDPRDGKKHQVGTTWNSKNCLRCSCGFRGMECCSRFGGIGVAPPNCEVYKDEVNCNYKVHKKGDPTTPC